MAKQEEVKDTYVKKEEAIEGTYNKSEMISNAQAFGVMPEVMAGALYGVKKDALTRKEAEEAIKKFLERKCV